MPRATLPSRPLQNRVTPLGELVADPARGLVYGNRGCLHDEHGRIRRRYAGKRWIACRLRFKDWRRHPLLRPGKFTELFFLDEATAFAAGHRPCALCRREDYTRLLELWGELGLEATGADDVDARLHAERVDRGSGDRRLHAGELDDLPDGTFVLHGNHPHLVLGGRLLPWTPAGYDPGIPRPRGQEAAVITPPSLVALLRRGWDSALPLVHDSAQTVSGSIRPVPALD